MKRVSFCLVAVLATLLLVPSMAAAQPGLTLPSPGGNPKASVSQWIGMVEVNVTYNSPDVTGPQGQDRTGQIWGQLVPYGMANLGFGSCGDNCPWRAGANENTTFTVSHDVLVQGEPLPAGTYGLHMIPGETERTIIFSKNSQAWGSFFYDEADDQLRVTAKPEEHSYTHWLNYAFTDRQPNEATVALQWENLQLPWTVSVPDVNELYLASIRRELSGNTGFNYLNWVAAANFCVQNNINLEEGLEWAQAAVSAPFIGQEDFNTLTTLGRLQAANGKGAEASETIRRAANHATANPIQVHQMARQLIGQGQQQLAMEIFELNHAKLDGAWPGHVGMARGLSALGKYDEALEHAKKALPQAPDDLNRTNMETLIGQLEKGEDIN